MNEKVSRNIYFKILSSRYRYFSRKYLDTDTLRNLFKKYLNIDTLRNFLKKYLDIETFNILSKKVSRYRYF